MRSPDEPVEWLANWRSRYMHMPYGDQAIFMRKEVFREMGGFPEIPIMEDLEFVRRLKRRGQIEIVEASVQTSPRRWLHFGILKTWLVNQMIIIAFYLGISSHRLARWYRREAGKSRH